MNKNVMRQKLKSLPLVSSTLKKIRKEKKRRRMIGFYSQFVHKGDLCFDIGANIGDWSVVFLSLGASVVAVEPQLLSFESLLKKFGNNSFIKILQCGVGSKEEVKELIV